MLTYPAVDRPVIGSVLPWVSPRRGIVLVLAPKFTRHVWIQTLIARHNRVFFYSVFRLEEMHRDCPILPTNILPLPKAIDSLLNGHDVADCDAMQGAVHIINEM